MSLVLLSVHSFSLNYIVSLFRLVFVRLHCLSFHLLSLVCHQLCWKMFTARWFPKIVGALHWIIHLCRVWLMFRWIYLFALWLPCAFHSASIVCLGSWSLHKCMERTQSTNANNFRKHKTKNEHRKCKMKRANLYQLTTQMRVYRKPKTRIQTNNTLNTKKRWNSSNSIHKQTYPGRNLRSTKERQHMNKSQTSENFKEPLKPSVSPRVTKWHHTKKGKQ
jgi:hypothetical protein